MTLFSTANYTAMAEMRFIAGGIFVPKALADYLGNTLEDAFIPMSSNIAQKDLNNKEGNYPIYGASGLIGYVNFYKQEQPYIAIVKDGAGVGRVFCLPAHSSVIGTMQYLLPKENINIKFLYYALKFMWLERYYTGATIPHIYFKDYKKERLQIPTKERQEFIAQNLYSIDKILNLLNQELTKLDQLIKSRFIEMFGDLALSSNMQEVCKIITDGTHQPPKFVSTGIPFIFVSNIVNDYLTYNAEKFISEDTYNELVKRTPIEIGDLLLSTVGSYGHPAIVESERKFLFQRHIAYLKPDHSKINSQYLHAVILSDAVQRQIESKVKGIAQKTLNLSEIKSLRIPLPKMELQNQFADFVQLTDKSKLVAKALLAKCELLRGKLMQDYFG